MYRYIEIYMCMYIDRYRDTEIYLYLYIAGVMKIQSMGWIRHEEWWQS